MAGLKTINLAIGIENLNLLLIDYDNLLNKYYLCKIQDKNFFENESYTPSDYAIEFRLAYLTNQIFEVSFKILTWLSGKEFKKSHSIFNLYKELNSDFKHHLDSEYRNWRNSYNPTIQMKKNFELFEWIYQNGKYEHIKKDLKDIESLSNFLENLSKFKLDVSRYWFAEFYNDKKLVSNFNSVFIFDEVLKLIVKFVKEDLLIRFRSKEIEGLELPLKDIPDYLSNKNFLKSESHSNPNLSIDLNIKNRN